MSDVAKLPKWAQDKIRQLELRNSEKDVLIEALQPKHSRIVSGYEPVVNLPDFGRARFLFPSTRHPHGFIEAQILGDRHHLTAGDEPGLYIMAHDSILVEPTASNCLVIRFKRQ